MSYLDKYLLIATNLVDEYSNLEDIIYVLALNIVHFTSMQDYKQGLTNTILDFMKSAIDASETKYNNLYQEDLKMVLKDIEQTDDWLGVNIHITLIYIRLFIKTLFFRLTFKENIDICKTI